MNILFTALTVLSNITGFASSQNYDTSAEHLLDCMFEHFGEYSPLAVEESILNSEDIYDMDGTNRYLLLSFIDGEYVIYDKKEESIFQTYESNPYEGFDDKFKLLGNINEKHLYAYFNEEINDFTFIDNTSFSKDEIHSYFTNQAYSYGNYYKNVPKPSNIHEINNSFYFENLHDYHGENDGGTCSVIASEILLGYYDTFLNDKIVDEQYDQPAIQYINKTEPTIRDFTQSPGVDTLDNDPFHEMLCNIARNEVGDDPRVDGMSVPNQKSMMMRYLNTRDMAYSIRSSEGNLSELMANKAKTVIKEAINQNRPVIACGEGHCSVAYAYSDTMVWVHTGWGYAAATPWRTFESGLFYNYSAGAIDFLSINHGEHLCSDNYYVSNKNVYLCPQCGKVYRISDIVPSDCGISSTYYSTQRTSSLDIDDEHVRIEYKRAALLTSNETTISLSARKNGEGEAYAKYWMTKKIRRVEFNICFYSASESLSRYDSNLKFWAIRYRNEDGGYFYYDRIEDLLQHGISSNRYAPTHLMYNFMGDDVFGIRFTVEAPATGNYDSGRVLIGNISIERSVNAHGYYSN